MFDRTQALATEAGMIALSHFGRLTGVAVESKGHLDLVTQADRKVERFLVEELHKTFPDDGIYGEEGGSYYGTSGRTWVIDPIDGTFNFVRGGDQWAISIGLLHEGVPDFGVLHVPVRRQTFVGGRTVPPTLNGTPMNRRDGLDQTRGAVGVGFHPSIPVDDRLEILRFLLEERHMAFRCCGSATISLIEVALGQVDGYIGVGDSSWDLVAAFAIFEQIGISSTVDWKDADLSGKFKFAAGTNEFLAAVKPIIKFGIQIELLECSTSPK